MAQKIMSNHLALKDPRVIKTNRALYEALFKILLTHNFNRITVNEICSEALVSRAAFYSHYHDKYDLLDYVLSEIQKDIVKNMSTYVDLETNVNQLINSNKKIIANILKDANRETLTLLRKFIASIVDPSVKKVAINKASPQLIILSNFLVGGLLNLLTWIVENSFPSDVSMINSYLYRMLETLLMWDAEQMSDSVHGS